jgi:hypothetical protein
MKTNQDNSDTLDAAVRGAMAVIDYSGMVVWSVLSRSGCAIKKNVPKMGKRIGGNLSDPFTARNMKPRKDGGRKKPQNLRTTRPIEEKIALIEERLASLEKHGVRISETGEYQKKHKELDDERRGLLALIVEENKELKSLLNT